MLDVAILGDHKGAVQEHELVSPARARAAWATFRGNMGANPNATNLLTWPGAQPKANKSPTPTYVLHLAPEKATGQYNACPWATKGCAAACLNTAGRGRFDGVQEGRKLRTRWFAVSPVNFLSLITHEIELARSRHGGEIAVRLNGTSDVRWEKVAPFLFERWDDVIFYDYTKAAKRTVPANYHLTYSVNELDKMANIEKMIGRYGRAAIVLALKKSAPMPSTWQGIPLVDGDKDDQRWQNTGVLVGLRAKGQAIGDTTSGFVRPCNQERFPTAQPIRVTFKEVA